MWKIKLDKGYEYEELMEGIFYLNETYKSFIQVKEIGKSHDERAIPMIKLGKGKKGIICCAGVHGRETINPVVILHMVECYLKIHAGHKDVDIHGLWRKKMEDNLQDYSFYFIPLLNPDGYAIALKGFDAIRKEGLRSIAEGMGIPFKEWKYNARGMDINRNFPSVTWKGVGAPGSEAETKALMKVFNKIDSIGFLDFHSRGKSIYYHRKALNKEYNVKQKYLARNIAKLTGYVLVPPEEELDERESGGNTVHYYAEHKKKPAFTIETVDGNAGLPLAASCQTETFYEILKTPFLLCQ